MYLFDFLFTLPPNVYVRIKFDGSADEFCFTTGERNTGKNVAALTRDGRTESKVHDTYPLWHAQELYLKCT